MTLSRASGKPVVAKAIRYAVKLVQGKLTKIVETEFADARSRIDIMGREGAVSELYRNDIYAEGGMGCAGPVVRVSEANIESVACLRLKD